MLKIGIQRIHVEEDTGKSTHDSEKTLLDYNRAGVPLIEIVTEPDLSSSDEARSFLENLRQRLKFIEVSDVKMEEGSLRCDVNINVVDEENKIKHAIAEIKNLNSFRAVERAIIYEEERQKQNLLNGELSSKETRRWDEASMSTILMRKKDEENDYRFTVEADLPRVEVSDEFINSIKASIPELPREKKERYMKEYNLSEYDADILSRDKDISMYFEKLIDAYNDPSLIASWILTETLRRLKEHELEITEIKLSNNNFIKLLELVKLEKISNNSAKKIFREIFETNEDPEKLMVSMGLEQNNDPNFLINLVNEVIDENPQSIEDFKAGKDRAAGFLMGQVMKKSKGKANPQEASKLIKEELLKR